MQNKFFPPFIIFSPGKDAKLSNRQLFNMQEATIDNFPILQINFLFPFIFIIFSPGKDAIRGLLWDLDAEGETVPDSHCFHLVLKLKLTIVNNVKAVFNNVKAIFTDTGCFFLTVSPKFQFGT